VPCYDFDDPYTSPPIIESHHFTQNFPLGEPRALEEIQNPQTWEPSRKGQAIARRLSWVHHMMKILLRGIGHNVRLPISFWTDAG
jgi:hypothetical protein